MKQFIGTWQAEVGTDTVAVITFSPHYKGLHALQEKKTNGNTYATYIGVIGLADTKEMCFGAFISNDGTTIFVQNHLLPGSNGEGLE